MSDTHDRITALEGKAPAFDGRISILEDQVSALEVVVEELKARLAPPGASSSPHPSRSAQADLPEDFPASESEH